MKKLITSTCLILLFISIGHSQDATEPKENSKDEQNLSFKIKENSKADIYVDGKKFNFNVEIIDPNKIASVSVIKGEQALKDYKAPNGVILIKTKNEDSSEKTKETIRNSQNREGPMIIVDGTVVSKDYLEKIDPNEIKEITVYKDESAIKKFNAPNGVIDITTKTGKNKKE